MIPRTLEGLELGERMPSQQEVDWAATSRPLPGGARPLRVVIGDVRAGLTAAIHGDGECALRHYAFDDRPAEVMRKTNRSLCRRITEEGCSSTSSTP